MVVNEFLNNAIGQPLHATRPTKGTRWILSVALAVEGRGYVRPSSRSFSVGVCVLECVISFVVIDSQ